MNIQILHSWLIEHLETNAKPKEIAELSSLCGPSFEKTIKHKNDYIYDIEVTSNRVDMMSVYGIAREVATILNRFKKPTKLKPLQLAKVPKIKNNLNFKVINNEKLIHKMMGIVLTDIQNWESPKFIKERLEAAGIRSLNSVIDITNYVMIEVGHPTHAFDYDKIKNKKFIVRESKNGEKVVTLDNKTHILPEGVIVFDNAEGEIIDLPGIMGAKSTSVDNKTKNVLFFMESADPIKIRKASLKLEIRTLAAQLNEKGVDPELSQIALLRGIKLFQDICKAKIASNVINIYPKKIKSKEIKTDYNYIKKILDIEISKEEISKILISLNFNAKWEKDVLITTAPSFRNKDIQIKEDIIEEIARIYGYHNLPSKVMNGLLPLPNITLQRQFDFENYIKNILVSLNAHEIYTLSLAPKEEVDTRNAVKIKNPMGEDGAYMRTSLKSGLLKAIKENVSTKNNYFLFELANIYLKNKNDLPEERLILAGVLINTNFLNAKGVVSKLLNKLNINFEERYEKTKVIYTVNKKSIGLFEILSETNFYFEFNLFDLFANFSYHKKYEEPNQYPPQIEDVTFIFPNNVLIGNILKKAKKSSKFISNVLFIEKYNDAITLRIFYQSKIKTLTDNEVHEYRTKLVSTLQKEFGAKIKD